VPGLLSRVGLAGVLGAVAATSFGCAAPEASFNAFTERYDKIEAAKPPAPPTECLDTYVPFAAGEADGQYLLVVSVVLKPKQPLLFFAEVTTPATDGDVGIGFTLTPVSKTDRQTLVGDKSKPFGPVALNESGEFELPMPGITVPKEANSVIDVPVDADILLMGNICGDAAFSCGDVTGETVSPKADLKGSTFTLMRIDDEAKFPEPLLDCKETPADPIP